MVDRCRVLECQRHSHIELPSEALGDRGDDVTRDAGFVETVRHWRRVADANLELRSKAVSGWLADGEDIGGLQLGNDDVVPRIGAEFTNLVFHGKSGDTQPPVDRHRLARTRHACGKGHRVSAAELGFIHVVAAHEERAGGQNGENGTEAEERRPQTDPVDTRQQRARNRGHDGRQHRQPLHTCAEQHAKHRTGHPDAGEERRDDTDGHGEGEALDLGCADLVENDAGDEVGDVAVDDGAERAPVRDIDGLLERIAQVKFFANALVNKHVRVDCHCDRERNARESWQREGAVDERHDAEDHQGVDRESDVGDQSREEVVREHHHASDGDRDDGGFETLLEVVGADGRAEDADRNRIARDLRLEAARGEHADEVREFFFAELAGDDTRVGDGAVEARRAVNLIVEDDRHWLADIGAGELSHALAAALVELETDRRGAEALVHGAIGVGESPGSAAAVGQSFGLGVVEQQVEITSELADAKVARSEVCTRVGLERLEFGGLVVPLLEIIQTEPTSDARFARTRSLGHEVLAKLIRIDALRLGWIDGDAEVEDARTAHEANEILWIVKTRALGKILVVGANDLIELSREIGELGLDRAEFLLAQARSHFDCARGRDHDLAFGIANRLGCSCQVERPSEARGSKSLGEDLTAQVFVAKFGADDLVFGWTQLVGGRAAGLKTIEIGTRLLHGLPRAFEFDDGGILLAKARGRAAGGECAVEFGCGDLRLGKELVDALLRVELQRADFRRWKWHDHLNAVGALRLHADVEHSLRIHPLLEHLDDLPKHGLRLLPRGDLDRVDQAHTALEVLTKADALHSEFPSANSAECGNDGELHPGVLHVLFQFSHSVCGSPKARGINAGRSAGLRSIGSFRQCLWSIP